jgi:hypothetical protein
MVEDAEEWELLEAINSYALDGEQGACVEGFLDVLNDLDLVARRRLLEQITSQATAEEGDLLRQYHGAGW